MNDAPEILTFHDDEGNPFEAYMLKDRLGRRLPVQAPQHPARALRLVVLAEDGVAADRAREVRPAPAFREGSARVAVRLRLEQEHPGKGGRVSEKGHGAPEA